MMPAVLGSRDRDRRNQEEGLIDASAADDVLYRLHRLGGADGDAAHVECEPGLQRIRWQWLIQTRHAVKVVPGLLHIFAVKTGFGWFCVRMGTVR